MIFEGPINSLSLGNVSYNFARELYRAKDLEGFFPVAQNFDLSSFSPDENFSEFLKEKNITSLSNLNKHRPLLKCWHLNGSERSLVDRQYLYTFYEVDSPTKEEVSIVNRQEAVFFSSEEAMNAFSEKGCKNVYYVPLGFDEEFQIQEKKIKPIHFALIGKFEQRKNTERIIRLWLDKYGNNNDYLLTCLVSNPFFTEQTYKAHIKKALGNRNWSNINFLPRLKSNKNVADLHGALDIDLSGLSSGEGWNLPAFNSTCLGKWAVVTNCSGHKGWATRSNCILVEPNGKIPCYDGMFFREGSPFNQGNYYNITDDAIIDGIERAVKLARQPNVSGEELGKKMTYQNSMRKIYAAISL